MPSHIGEFRRGEYGRRSSGYWIVEGTHERAVEIAERVVAHTEYPMEVRRVMDESPEM